MIAGCRFSRGSCLMVNWQANEKVKAGWWRWRAQITVTTGSPHLCLCSLLSTSLNPRCLTCIWWSPLPFSCILSAFPPLVLFLVLSYHCLDYWPASLLLWTCLLVWTLPAGMNSTWWNIKASRLSVLQTITCKERVQIKLWCVEHERLWAMHVMNE